MLWQQCQEKNKNGLKTKKQKTWKLRICAKGPSQRLPPFGPVSALLGTRPKEVAGSVGESGMQRQVQQRPVQNGRKRGDGLGQARPLQAGRPLWPLTQGRGARVITGTCLRPDALWGKQTGPGTFHSGAHQPDPGPQASGCGAEGNSRGCFLLPVTFSSISNFSVIEKT